MAKSDKLITYAYLKEECDIPQNIPDEEFEHKIFRAQEMLRMLMSDEFYQDFLTAYRASGTTPLSTAYQSMYSPYIKQFIAWQTYEFWLLKANFKVTRSGIRVHSEENSVVATDQQMGNLLADAKRQGQYYKKLMIDFLKGNSTDYPLYGVCCNSDLAGNSFHISAVKNKTHSHDCKCNRCR